MNIEKRLHKNNPKSKTTYLRLFLFFLLFTIYFLLFAFPVLASDYVLPYPGFMPGHKLYKTHQVWEKFKEYWHFGNLSKYKYYLKTSDKYLVEAKTLFEYNQYHLATQSLAKSDDYFNKAALSLYDAKKEPKDLSKKIEELNDAKDKHIEILSQLLGDLPKKIEWQEEKKEKVDLEIEFLINVSIKQRETAVTLL